MTATATHPRQVTQATDAPVMRDLGADLSPAVKALEVAYRKIQRAYPDAPPVTIVVKRDQRAWGHTTVHEAWGHREDQSATRLEVMISGENLRRGAEYVAATLLHEAAHARNLAANVRDCDVNGRHNTRFRDRAVEMGLTCEENGWHGWTVTALDEAGQARWKGLIAGIAKGLDASAVAMAHKPAEAATGGLTLVPPVTGVLNPPRRGGRRNLLKAVCDCGHSIRLSQTVLDVAKPTCQVCGQAFAPVD